MYVAGTTGSVLIREPEVSLIQIEVLNREVPLYYIM